MLQVLVTLSVAAVVGAQICCVPKQWEGVQGNVLAAIQPNDVEPMILSSSYMISYDAINKRVATIESLSSGNFSGTAGVILDYSAGIQYTIQGPKCTRTTLGSFLESCIPSNAHNDGDTYYGAITPLNVTAYSYVRHGFNVLATVTQDTCAPVQEVIYGDYAGNRYMQSVGYSNITPGIKDSSVFMPPAFCDNVPLIHSNLPVFPMA
ncbi:ependymin-related protein 1-like [Mizuhopecten yessoensis]|uniref:Ependymin-related protein 1 n=1 Tax=Mizuhopecten yessoensis TaxID=6573 RepID=A0A210QPI2_MIZYE|nr:ependymin-related protein 1-like [Mizuhopecten yessoensis]OWF50608.1 Ependymin-related protein 1 [Mizuhopecten yessoensis]